MISPSYDQLKTDHQRMKECLERIAGHSRDCKHWPHEGCGKAMQSDAEMTLASLAAPTPERADG